MKLLLDTHIYLWWLADPAKLADEARTAIANPRNFVFVSAVSVVEIAIKQGTGKLKASEPPEAKLEECRFHELPLRISHATALRGLPPIHRDPFDRLLIAQAMADGLTLVTCDPEVMKYEVPLLAA